MLSPNETRILTEKYKGLEYLNLPVALVDQTFSILHFNSSFSRLLQSLDDVFPAKDFSQIFENFAEKLSRLQESGLSKGYLQNFVIPGVTLKSGGLLFDLYVGRLSPEFDHLDGFTVTCVEVSERENEIRRLQELGDHHNKFLEHTTSGVIIHRNGTILYANPQVEQLVHLPKGENLEGHSVWEFVTEEFREVVTERVKRMEAEGETVPPLEERFRCLDGSTFFAEVFAYPVTYRGEPAIKTIINDISERKRAENKLRDSEKQYSALVENLNDVVFQTDTDACFTFLNGYWEKLTGFKVSETLGRSCFDFLEHPTNTESFYQKIRRLISSGVEAIEYELLLSTRNGEHKYVEVSLSPVYDHLNRIAGISGLIRDIHAKKLTQIEIRSIHEKLRNQQRALLSLARDKSVQLGAFEDALQLIARVSCDTTQANIVNIWQLTENGKKLTEIVNFDRDKKQFQGCVSFRTDDFPVYFSHLLKDRIINSYDSLKDERLVEFFDMYLRPAHIVSSLSVSVIVNEEIWGFICFDQKESKRHWSVEDQLFARSVADIISLAYEASNRKHTQIMLEKSEDLYRNLIEQASDAIFVVDDSDKLLEMNRQVSEITGFGREELLGASLDTIIPREAISGEHTLAEEVRRLKHLVKECRVLTKSGEERILEISAAALPGGKVQGYARDITDRKIQEKALQESEARLDLALKGADLGTWDFFIQENRMIHNRRWAEMLGYNFEITVVNAQFWEKFVHPDDIAQANAAFEKHLRGETPYYEATIRMLASNGEYRWIFDRGKVVEYDANGDPLRASGIHQDVTALKYYEQQLQKQKIFLQEILNAIPNYIYVKNVQDSFVVVNKALADLFGTTPEELMQYHAEYKNQAAATLSALFEKDNEVFITRKPVFVLRQEIPEDGGHSRWLQSIKLPLYDEDGNIAQILSVSSDITELILKESELEKLNDQLELKVSERTSLLELANKELETFNYSVSHDLRTPLRTIDIFAYFLEKNYRNSLDNEGMENIRQIRQSILKMSALIDNLLIFSKMGRAETKLTELETGELVREVIAEIRETAGTLNAEFHIGELPDLHADYSMMKQAFHNLIENAIKFTRIRRNPLIEISGSSEEGSVTIAIRDNGVGFSMEYKDKLFKAFKRLHSDEQFEGTGVGLAIVERIIKRHKGQIWAESEENRGTTFYFRIPA